MKTQITITRRAFMKRMARASAMATAASLFPGIIFAEEQLKNIPQGTITRALGLFIFTILVKSAIPIETGQLKYATSKE